METTGGNGSDDVKARSVGIQVETKEESSTRQEQTTKEADNVLKSLSPLINSMKLFGLYFARQPREDPSDSSQPSWRSLGRCQRWTPTRIYATIIFVVIWVNTTRYHVIFDGISTFGVEMLMKLGLMSSVLLTVLLQTAYYVASHSGSLDRIFRQVNLSAADFCQKYSRRAKVVTVVCWTLMAFCMFCYILPMFTITQYGDETLLDLINSFHMSSPYAEIVSVIFVVLEVQVSAAWVFPQAVKITTLLEQPKKTSLCLMTLLIVTLYHVPTSVSSSNELHSDEFAV